MTKLLSKSNLKFRLPKRNFITKSYTDKHKQIELKYREPKPFYEFLHQGKPISEQELLKNENLIKTFKYKIYAINSLKSLLKLGIIYLIFFITSPYIVGMYAIHSMMKKDL